MKKHLLILLTITLLLVGCAQHQPPTVQAVSSYTRMVTMFNVIGDGLKSMCIDHVIDQKTCSKIGRIHDQVASALDQAGYFLELMITMNDPKQVALCSAFIKPCKSDDLECYDENLKTCLDILGKKYESNIIIARKGLIQLKQYYSKHK